MTIRKCERIDKIIKKERISGQEKKYLLREARKIEATVLMMNHRRQNMLLALMRTSKWYTVPS